MCGVRNWVRAHFTPLLLAARHRLANRALSPTDLTPEATILFASDSVYDILGYQPWEIQGKSCFDYFHPDEVPFARSVHNRGVLLDKAAVLHYARIRASDGRWVSCECCFTIVHDVLVACTSIYLRGEKSERRALEAPQIRRIFSCSPRDPRYHMLEYLSPKFRMPAMEREPRAALILNRFTRNLSIMFATNAVSTILGLRPDELKGKAFYECIQENCLQDAVRCLESAKANESIAYLRFWFRDPRVGDDNDNDMDDDDGNDDHEEEEEEEDDTEATTDSEGGGAELYEEMDVDSDGPPFGTSALHRNNYGLDNARPGLSSHTNSSFSDAGPATAFSPPPAQMYQTPGTSLASRSTRRGVNSPVPSAPGHRPRLNRQAAGADPFELEAVVSCTSDGLVVVLRKARPPIPAPHPPLVPAVNYENGLFAAPWGQNPIRPQLPPELLYTFRPPLMPEHMPLREGVKAAGGPPSDQLMRSIRDVAVFAWAIVGINGNLATYGHGLPRDRAQPDILPLWDPEAGDTDYEGPENLVARRWGKVPAKDAQPQAAPAMHFTRNPSPQPLEPSPQQHSYTPLQPSSLEHYTYSGSSGWAQPRPISAHFGREEYQGYGSSLRDSFSPGPAVLPPLQFQHSGREPQQPQHQAYQPAPSYDSSNHVLPPIRSQPQQPHVEAAAAQAYQQSPAPVPSSSSPTQGASISALRYLWQ